MCFTKYSLCETYCQGSSEISFIHLNINDLFYKYHSPVIEHQYTFEIVESFLEKNCLLDPSGGHKRNVWRPFGGQKISALLMMTHPGNQLRRYAMINLISRGLITNSFQGMIRRCQKCVDAQGSTSPVNSKC